MGVPDEVTFKTKWELSLDQIDALLRWGLKPRVVLADPAYGDVTEYRDGLVGRNLPYVVGVQSTLVAWAPGTGPIAPPRARPPGQHGRSPTR